MDPDIYTGFSLALHLQCGLKKYRLQKTGQAGGMWIILVWKTLSQRLILGAGNLFGSARQNVYCLLINIIHNTWNVQICRPTKVNLRGPGLGLREGWFLETIWNFYDGLPVPTPRNSSGNVDGLQVYCMYSSTWHYQLYYAMLKGVF